jgi:hypothetical protein
MEHMMQYQSHESQCQKDQEEQEDYTSHPAELFKDNRMTRLEVRNENHFKVFPNNGKHIASDGSLMNLGAKIKKDNGTKHGQISRKSFG